MSAPSTRRVLMLVWTSVATDTRVLREATALVGAGYQVHIIGRAIPAEFVPPTGITLGSVGAPPRAQGRTRSLSPPERLARWALLPNHVARRLGAWQQQAAALAQTWVRAHGVPDVVHAHDFTALPVGAQLADQWSVPLIYDTHEYWVGRPVEGRPAPVRRRREAALESQLAARAAAVITVGDGVARALRADHPDWPEVVVVRNTFPAREIGTLAAAPRGAVYAGRLAADRELEVIAAGSLHLDLPITIVGPSDDEWLKGFECGKVTVLPAESLDQIDARLTEAGIGLVTHSDRWANHRLALPNKLFHAVSLGVPVVAADVGELAAMVREYSLGTLYQPGDSQSFVAAVRDMCAEHQAYAKSVRDARPALSWEQDATRLLETYRYVNPAGASTTLGRPVVPSPAQPHQTKPERGR